MNSIDLLNLGFLGESMGGGEILVILLAILMLFGSKNLPSIARNLGKSMETFRKASRDMTHDIMHADLLKDTPPPPKTQTIAPPKIVEAETTGEETIAVKPSAHSVERDENSGV